MKNRALNQEDQMLLAVPSNDQSWNWLSLEAFWPRRWLSGIIWVCKLKASTAGMILSTDLWTAKCLD
ncbi:hypothetical protein NC652_036872 [Populus alba x Populus x berolinensis]|nr:hypothetical protein NC652_036872 [Populus alba x Populus x berolinensis]